jgi:hypothetical protein
MGSVVGVQYVLPAQPVDGDVISSGAQIKGKKVKGQPLVLRKVQVGEHLQPAAEPAERRIAQVGVGTSKGDNPMYTSVLTMEEARQLTNERNTEVKASNPRQILADLKAGNNRFWTGKSEQENLSLVARSVLIDGQAPKVMVIGCADSRVPIEIILDQGLGTRSRPPASHPAAPRRAPTPRGSSARAHGAPAPPSRAPSSQATCLCAVTRATSGARPSPARWTTPSTTSASS